MFIVFDSFSDNTYHIQFLLNAVDVQLGVGSITTVDANGLQSEQLFQDAALLTEIYDSVQFDVVTGTMEDTMLDDKLFRGNNELEFAIVDEESVALESGTIIEGTFAFNDLSPFQIETDDEGRGIEVSDEDRIEAAKTAYHAAIRRLKLSRRTYKITIEVEEVPADLAPGDKVRLIYDNSLYILDECSAYQKKILSMDDWFYITGLDYNFNEDGVETDVLTLEKYLRIDRETSTE